MKISLWIDKIIAPLDDVITADDTNSKANIIKELLAISPDDSYDTI